MKIKGPWRKMFNFFAPANVETYAGYIDEITEYQIRGWASCDKMSTIVSIIIPGLPLMTVYPDHERPDVAQAGFALNSGFRVRLPRPLSVGTKVVILAANGQHLKNSPWRFIGKQS